MVVFLPLFNYISIYTYLYLSIYLSTYISISISISISIYLSIYAKLYVLLFVDGVQLPQGYIEPLRVDSLLFTRNSWYSLDQYKKDERLRWPWSHPVVLILYINLVITKYKLKWQFKLTQLWPLTVNYFKVSCQSYLVDLSKICFFCTYLDQMIIQ